MTSFSLDPNAVRHTDHDYSPSPTHVAANWLPDSLPEDCWDRSFAHWHSNGTLTSTMSSKSEPKYSSNQHGCLDYSIARNECMIWKLHCTSVLPNALVKARGFFMIRALNSNQLRSWSWNDFFHGHEIRCLHTRRVRRFQTKSWLIGTHEWQELIWYFKLQVASHVPETTLAGLYS